MAQGVTKAFRGQPALVAVTARFFGGELSFLCGENGAGKSTLLKVLSGVIEPDAGEVRVFGAPRARGVAAVRAQGVAIVHQHFALFDALTGWENVRLIQSTAGGAEVSALRRRVEARMRELELPVPLDRPVREYGVGDRQRLEILRALVHDVRALILDEPTAVLSPVEVAPLYATLDRVRAAGAAVVVVTHHLDEVRTYADRILVLRRGELTQERAHVRGEPVGDVARSIMGVVDDPGGERAKLGPGAPEEPAQASRRSGVIARGSRDGKPIVDLRGAQLGMANLTLQVHAGEIVGVAGVEGNGQRELVELLSGQRLPDIADVCVLPSEVAWVSDDRQTEGLLLGLSVAENVMLGDLPKVARLGWVDPRAFDAEVDRRLALTHPKGAPRDLVQDLSGGNQQKVVLARALAREGAKRLLVLAQPTRGVDLGAKLEIHGLLRAAREQGATLVIISADLDELRSLADTLYVLARGKLVGPFAHDTSDLTLGRAMLSLDDSATSDTA
jgi:simple sugar transport system ATP-binding protein